LRARKKSGDLTTAIVPAGTSFPAVLRERFDLVIARYAAATSFLDQLNSVPSIHMRCRMDATAHPPLQHNQLMSERRVLCLKSALRLERRGEQGQEEAEQRDHRR
jgi:hypothetical protein